MSSKWHAIDGLDKSKEYGVGNIEKITYLDQHGAWALFQYAPCEYHTDWGFDCFLTEDEAIEIMEDADSVYIL